MAKRLEEVEVSKGRIRVTGELHHARLRRLAATRSPEVIRALRTEWGAGPETTAILFASECAREMAMVGRPSPYDEVAILRQLLRTKYSTSSTRFKEKIRRNWRSPTWIGTDRREQQRAC